jgi:hypothetical protein
VLRSQSKEVSFAADEASFAARPRTIVHDDDASSSLFLNDIEMMFM